MTSWPGTLWPRATQWLFINAWTKSKSEVSPSTRPNSQELQEQDNGKEINSTASGTLQPLSPLLSEASVPKTTPTAPMCDSSRPDTQLKDEDTTEDNICYPDDANNDDQHENSSQSSIPEIQLQSSPEPNEASNWHRMPPPLESPRETRNKVTKLIEQVVNTHKDVSTKRYRIREMRYLLRQKRDEEGDVRITLRSKLNLMTTETMHDDVAAINDTMDQLQNATASYFILENEYHRQESELAELEHDYDKRLEQLQTTLQNQGSSLAQFEAHDSNTDSSADYTSDYGDDISPERAEYLSLVGEARILVERLSELESEYLILQDQCEQREHLGYPLDTSAMNFLLSYPAEKASIEAELELARQNVESHPEHGNNAHVDEHGDEDQVEMIRRFLPELGDQRYNDPLRSSEFEDPSPFFASAHTQPVNKNTFVDRWLLHQLRHSRFEIMRFKSAPELVDLTSQGLGSDKISRMALMFWFQDGTAAMEHVRSHSGE